MATKDSDEAALARDFAAAGLDPTGIDLAWLAGIRTETEAKIASYRGAEGFGTADPAFNPPKILPDRTGTEQ
jgi:hypothetical protein